MAPPAQQNFPRTTCAFCQQSLPCLDIEFTKHVQLCHSEIANINGRQCLLCGLQLTNLTELFGHLSLTMVTKTF